MFEGRRVFDITKTIMNGLTVWPGDPGITISQSLSIKKGGGANVSRMDMGVHTGTHMDAPLHFIDDAKDMASLDINRFFGRVLVISSDLDEIGEEVLEGYDLKKYEAVFFKTRSSLCDEKTPFQDVFPALTESCARMLVEAGIKTVGIDYLSIECAKTSHFSIHKLLLSNEIAIVENLSMKDIEPGEYDFICLPLKIEGSDGSPVRALLIK